MKIIYCMRATYNPGGMERVLLNKVRYLVERVGLEVTVVTTDQKGRAPFYPFPKEVRMIDLGINYADDNDKIVFKKIAGYLWRKRLHKARLTALLNEERPDIVVSLYPSESSFIPDIKDGSKKVLELHFCKFFRIQYGRKGILGIIDRWRTKQDEKLVRKFDRFVVLTNEDKGYWATDNAVTIPNAALRTAMGVSCLSQKRIIAVGRLDYQKGFDRLLEAWNLIAKDNKHSDWVLDIFGQGEWHDMLQGIIDKYNISDNTHLNPPTNNIMEEYANSSFIVMSSNYEGFGMVLVEAMSCGVPAVAFDCKCGPRDIISNGHNGLLVADGDIQGLANAMRQLMDDDALRHRMGQEARKVVDTYSEERIMGQWVDLFSSLVETNA